MELMPREDNKFSSEEDVICKENTKARMVSHAPRWSCSCKGTRYPDAKLRRERTETRFNSSRWESNFNGRLSPWTSETRLKEDLNDTERRSRSMESSAIYAGKGLSEPMRPAMDILGKYVAIAAENGEKSKDWEVALCQPARQTLLAMLSSGTL